MVLAWEANGVVTTEWVVKTEGAEEARKDVEGLSAVAKTVVETVVETVVVTREVEARGVDSVVVVPNWGHCTTKTPVLVAGLADANGARTSSATRRH